MKKLMYVRTNGYDMLVTYDGEAVRFITDDKFPADDPVEGYLHHLDRVEDDSSWEYEDCTDIDSWLGGAEVLDSTVFA